MSLNGEPVSVVTRDGVTLAAQWHASPGMKAVMLLLPALAAPSKAMRVLASSLAGRGVAVMRADYRFHGESRPRPSRKHDAAMADLHVLDVPALLDELAKRAPGMRVVCAGHSLGGQLSALALSSRPELVRAAIMITTSMPHEKLWSFPDKFLVGLAFRLMPALGVMHGKLPAKPMGMGIEIPSSLIRDWGRWGRTGRYASRDADLAGVLQQARGPVLSIGASDDTLYAPKTALDAFLQMMPNAKTEQWMLTPDEMGAKALGHFGLLWPPASERLADRIASWIHALPS